jgi:ABC-2 type transport system ATP-binding protein
VTSGSEAVVVRGLVVERGGARVLHGIDVDVPRGSVVGLLGPSGCGKSTLMRAIVGVQIVAGGTIEVLGDAAGSPALRPRIGYVTQAPSVYGDLTVRENLRYFARVRGTPEGVEPVLETVGLGAYGDRIARRLSGGQLARVSLATALLGEPDLLVLDEPTVGLDPVLRVDLWGRFRALASTGVTLLVSSHVMDEAERCDRLLLMREGRILAADSPAGLLERTGAGTVEGAFLRLIGTSEGVSA